MKLCKRSRVSRGGMMASLSPYICFMVLISLLMRVEGQAGLLVHDEGEGFVSSFYLYIHSIRISKNFQGILLSRVLQFNHCYHFVIYFVKKIQIHIYVHYTYKTFCPYIKTPSTARVNARRKLNATDEK
jgi:hypothetical protein